MQRNPDDSGLEIPPQQLQTMFRVFAHFSNIADSAFELPNGSALTIDMPALRDAIQVPIECITILSSLQV